MTRSSSSLPQLIHVACVCAGHNASRDVVTLVKSVLFHRSGWFVIVLLATVAKLSMNEMCENKVINNDFL